MRVRSDLWNQFGGNSAGSGFRLVNSTSAAALRWSTELQAPTDTSSPVIGPDGTLYIGTVDGRLVAIDPASGHVKWRTEVAGTELAVRTPAVADDGTIYCLCTSLNIVTDHRPAAAQRSERGLQSFIVAVGADGAVRWRMPIRTLADLAGSGSANCILHGAPRVLSGPGGVTRVIFGVFYWVFGRYPEINEDATGPVAVHVLLIVDEQGRVLLFNPYEEFHIEFEVGGGAFDFSSATASLSPSISRLPGNASPCKQTPVVFGSFPATEPFTIVAPGVYGLYAFRWSEPQGALTGTPQLFALREPSPGPAAFPNGLLTGTAGPAATFIDPDTFTSPFPEPTPLSGSATVAGGLRQMYFLVRFGTLVAVDSDGAVWKRRNLDGDSVAFPALSANHVHVSTTKGLLTFSLDLQDMAFVAMDGGGYSSPAIGPDGTVYAAAGEKLFAFAEVGTPFREIRDHRRPPNVRDHRDRPPPAG